MREARRRNGETARRRASPAKRGEREDREQRTEQELVFGRNPVLEVVENGKLKVNKIWILDGFQDQSLKKRIVSFAQENKVPFFYANRQKLDSLSGYKNHQGIILSISPIEFLSVQNIIEQKQMILIAHEIEDTHNLGAMIRTFVAAGGKGVILTGRSGAGINATVIKTSAGALFQCEFARASNCVNVLNELKESGFWAVGTDNSPESESVYKTNFPEKVAIVVGNEHEGLGQLIKKNCDFLVRVPISDKIDSLNVSVAFGIVLFEYLRQKAS